MLQSIILISPKEFHEGLGAIVKQAGPKIQVHFCENLVDLMLLDGKIFQHARLISFLNEFIVPVFVLKMLGYGGINFHPGLPSYPGHAPYSFALYNEEKIHGVTAHEMLSKVDAGKIIAVEDFLIPTGCNYIELIELSIKEAAKLFKKLSPLMISEDEPQYISESWGKHKTTKAQITQLCNISNSLSVDELKKLQRAFGFALSNSNL